jgi:hemerythrin-like metal-binding protein
LHFHTEEELLKQIKYPRTIQHIEKHRVLTEKFCAMQERLDVYDEDIHHKIALFLYRWLAKHILKADMDYKKYALKQQSFGFKQTIRKVV